jgi:DNA polymerase
MSISTNIVGLDFETYSDVDLIKHGLKRYVDSPNFKVLLAAVSMDQGDKIASLVIDFVAEPEKARQTLEEVLESHYIAAHNAMFEYTVLHKLGLHLPVSRFVDSAVMSRAVGLGSSLEAAAPQGLGIDKMASGKDLIRLFSIPSPHEEADGGVFDGTKPQMYPEKWDEFAEYCALDSVLSLQLALSIADGMGDHELVYSSVTMQMNTEGWKVDVPLVEMMQRRYQHNLEEEIDDFRVACDADELNLNSSKQMIDWCQERGVRIKSFDEEHVAKYIDKVKKKLSSMTGEEPEAEGYWEVLKLLRTKQAMGGSSLKKLQTILDTVSGDGYLYDQYLHAGASTTLRTTGRGVQMQNLHRLGGEVDDVTELMDPDVQWDNARMAKNLRQVFTASDPDGFLIVGDYKAVESRGLAWLSGEDWKLEAYRKGVEVYKMQAARFYGLDIDQVSKEQRTFGKTGELSCGYQAGADAVQSFASKMGVEMSHGEAKKLVSDFRETNPKTVAFWHALQSALDEALEVGISTVTIPHGTVEFETRPALDSLIKQEGAHLKTLVVKLSVPGKYERFVMQRLFHGVYRSGRSICYWKPSARKTGDLWVPTSTDPKTGEQRQFSLYGGKLAGILTQSLCREIFMDGLVSTTLWAKPTSNVRIVGQFHDEQVLDWAPAETVLDPELDETVNRLSKIMGSTDLPEFPLEADVKWAYRYTK